LKCLSAGRVLPNVISITCSLEDDTDYRLLDEYLVGKTREKEVGDDDDDEKRIRDGQHRIIQILI
jgi:hypothetical protein